GLSALVCSVQLEQTANRRNHKLVFVSEVEAVQTIDELSTICHSNLLGMAVEDVERHAAEHCVAESRHLLDEESGRRLASRTIPGPPFIDHQPGAVPAICLCHELPVTLDERLHLLAFL